MGPAAKDAVLSFSDDPKDYLHTRVNVELERAIKRATNFWSICSASAGPSGSATCRDGPCDR